MVEAGRAVIDEFRPSPQLFTLYSGWAFRFKTLSDGRRQILSFLLPGDFIGVQDEFADGQTHGVEAATLVTLCVFNRDEKLLWALVPQPAAPGLRHHLAGRARGKDGRRQPRQRRAA